MWSMSSGYLPVRRAVLDIPDYAEYLGQHRALKAYVEQLDVAQAPRPIDFEGLKITRNIAEAIEKATLGRMDVTAALNESAARSNALLKAVPTK